MSRLVPKIFVVKVATELRSRRKKLKIRGLILGRDLYGKVTPQMLDTHFHIALTPEHVTVFG